MNRWLCPLGTCIVIGTIIFLVIWFFPSSSTPSNTVTQISAYREYGTVGFRRIAFYHDKWETIDDFENDQVRGTEIDQLSGYKNVSTDVNDIDAQTVYFYLEPSEYACDTTVYIKFRDNREITLHVARRYHGRGLVVDTATSFVTNALVSMDDVMEPQGEGIPCGPTNAPVTQPPATTPTFSQSPTTRPTMAYLGYANTYAKTSCGGLQQSVLGVAISTFLKDTSTFEKCNELCAQTSGCTTFVWNTNSGFLNPACKMYPGCFANLATSQYYHTVYSKTPLTSRWVMTTSDYDGKRCQGESRISETTLSPEGCKKRCESQVGCVYVSQNRFTNHCVLCDNINDMLDDGDFITYQRTMATRHVIKSEADLSHGTELCGGSEHMIASLWLAIDNTGECGIKCADNVECTIAMYNRFTGQCITCRALNAKTLYPSHSSYTSQDFQFIRIYTSTTIV